METYVDIPTIDSLSEDGFNALSAVLPSFDFAELTNAIASGKNVFQANSIFNTIVSMFANELYSAVKILTVMVAIVLVSALLENLRSSFNKASSVSSEIILMALLGALAGEIFAKTSSYALNVSTDITYVMWSVLPALLTLTAGSGFTQTVVITNPILYFMCNVFAEIFNKILIPLSVTYFAISIADLMTDSLKLTNFRELIKKAYNFILGFIMTVFTGLLTVSSFAGSSLDSVGAKGVKFAISNAVPFVGRSISDAMGAVVSASMLLKNAVGISAIVVLLGVCIIPVFKTAATIIAIRISAAVCEPIADVKSVNILSSVADSLSMINAAVIATVIMMIISLSLIVGIK